MFITTKLVLDIETLAELMREGYDYAGPVELCKGDSTASAAEQSQSNFDNELMTIFQSQYNTQQSQLQYLQNQLEPQISNPQGYTPAQLAAQRTGATDTTSQEYQNAQAALNNETSAASGGSKLTGVSGAVAESDAALLNSEAQANASAQEQITTNNANLQQSNYWNAINALNGVAAQENPLGYSSSATSGSGAVAGLSQAVTASNQSQLLGAAGGVLGGLAAGWGASGFKV